MGVIAISTRSGSTRNSERFRSATRTCHRVDGRLIVRQTRWEGGKPWCGMGRREFVALLGGVAASWPLEVRSQQRERMRLIGVLLPGTADDVQYQARVGAFLQGMQEAGWVIGRNLRIDTRWATTNAADI